MPATTRQAGKGGISPYQQHVVRKGDTVFNISRRYEAATEPSMNRPVALHTLKLGQFTDRGTPGTGAQLVQEGRGPKAVKAANPVPFAIPQTRRYTLYSIARKFDVDIEDLKIGQRQNKTCHQSG